MLAYPITYEGFDGEKTETYYFNLNQVEAQRFIEGDLGKRMTRMAEKIASAEKTGADEPEGNEMFGLVEELVLMAFGKREGENFVKNATVREEFRSSMQFGELISQFVSDTTKFFDFFVGIMPKAMRGAVRTAVSSETSESPVPVLEDAGSIPEPQAQATAPPVAATVPEGVNVTEKTITKTAVIGMSSDEAQEYLAGGFRIIE